MMEIGGVGDTESYSKTCVKRPLKNSQNKQLNDKRQLNEG